MAQILLSLHHLFPTIRRAAFRDRPNRFVVRCNMGEAALQTAFMPNPGRLWELLFPDVPLWLADHGTESGRKHRYTVLAVERDGAPVFLHTHVNNLAAEAMLRAGLIPGLEEARMERREVTVGSSRFDFLLQRDGRPVLVEVKSCTLFGQGIAMFPDAVTERGRRHVEELTHLACEGYDTAVVFMVHSPDVDWFMPDYHTDLAFTHTLMAARDRVAVLPVAVEWTGGLELLATSRLLPIPWEYVGREAVDRGHYLVSFRMNESAPLPVGHYLAAGWAGTDLDAVLSRLSKPPKRSGDSLLQWCGAACEVTVIPVRCSRPIPELDSELIAFGAAVHSPEFDGRLVHCPEAPFRSRPFHEWIERLRMCPPEV